MKDKTQILLEQAYQKIYNFLREDAHDADEDQKLKKSFQDIITGYAKRGWLTDGLVDRNIGVIVDELFRAVQEHLQKSFESGQSAQSDIDAGFSARGED